MRHVFPTSAEVAHIWASQSQDDARCRNASFSGFKYYSYSTVIAEIRRNEMGQELVLLCTDNYSSTTCKHKYEVRRAVSHMRVIEVAEVQAILSDHEVNYRAFLRTHEDLIDLASRARQRKNEYLGKAASIVRDMTEYAAFFGLTWNVPAPEDNISSTQLLADYEAWRTQQDLERRTKRIAEQAENMALWLAGGDNRYGFDDFRLRIKDDEIQTSHGANIPVDHAVKIWPLLHKAHKSGKPFTPSIERTIHLGQYRLNGFADDVLTVGCHRIPYSEVERMAEQLGLLETA